MAPYLGMMLDILCECFSACLFYCACLVLLYSLISVFRSEGSTAYLLLQKGGIWVQSKVKCLNSPA